MKTEVKLNLLFWFSDFSPSATIGMTFEVYSEIPEQLLDGLWWNLFKIIKSPYGELWCLMIQVLKYFTSYPNLPEKTNENPVQSCHLCLGVISKC